MILGNKSFLPELSHVVDGTPPVFVTTEGRIGVIFEIPIIDLESLDADKLIAVIGGLINSLPSSIQLRFIQRANINFNQEALGSHTLRSQTISEIGFVKRNILISIEGRGADPIGVASLIGLLRRKGTSIDIAIEKFRSILPLSQLTELGAMALAVDEIKQEFKMPMAEVSVKQKGLIDSGDHLISVIRIYKPGTKSISIDSLSSLLDKLPMPFEVNVNVAKIPKALTDFKLRSQLAKTEVSARDPTSIVKQEATEKTLTETAMFGGSLCEIEWLVVFKRYDEHTLKTDLENAKGILSSFGDILIETVGSVPSFMASRIGGNTHYTFIEETGAIPFFLPVFGFGERLKKDQPARTLLFHRLDGSVHGYDQFNPKFLAYNAIISGSTGSGKSVLANALSQALLQDESIIMIKIDVGGSYKKECEALGGLEVNFNLNSPSGVNPFRLLSYLSQSNEAIDIVAEFLSALIKEEGEAQIPKVMRAQVEESLKHYALRCSEKASIKVPIKPSIDDFIKNEPKFPRIELLSRWASGGVFENALKEKESEQRPTLQKYQYFNFKTIQSASNRDFSEGVMAAVITMVNLEMLLLFRQLCSRTGDLIGVNSLSSIF